MSSDAKQKWREKNRDIVLQKAREYYQKNKENINAKHSVYYEKNKNVIIQNRVWIYYHANDYKRMREEYATTKPDAPFNEWYSDYVEKRGPIKRNVRPYIKRDKHHYAVPKRPYIKKPIAAPKKGGSRGDSSPCVKGPPLTLIEKKRRKIQQDLDKIEARRAEWRAQNLPSI